MVNQCIKYFLLPFAFLFAFAGVQADEHAVAAATDAQGQAPDGDQAAISGNKLYKFPGLQPTEEQLGAARHIPAAPSKNHPNGAGIAPLAFELKMQRLVAQYILRARNLHMSLTGCAIIFPFHYFW